MSILIKGMEMPKAQFQKMSTLYHVEGTIFIYPDGKARAELSVDYKNRKSYPLIPVPPHGRLIDADEFLKRAIGTKCFRGDYALMLEELVGESASILEAEECEG